MLQSAAQHNSIRSFSIARNIGSGGDDDTLSTDSNGILTNTNMQSLQYFPAWAYQAIEWGYHDPEKVRVGWFCTTQSLSLRFSSIESWLNPLPTFRKPTQHSSQQVIILDAMPKSRHATLRKAVTVSSQTFCHCSSAAVVNVRNIESGVMRSDVNLSIGIMQSLEYLPDPRP